MGWTTLITFGATLQSYEKQRVLVRDGWEAALKTRLSSTIQKKILSTGYQISVTCLAILKCDFDHSSAISLQVNTEVNSIPYDSVTYRPNLKARTEVILHN